MNILIVSVIEYNPQTLQKIKKKWKIKIGKKMKY